MAIFCSPARPRRQRVFLPCAVLVSTLVSLPSACVQDASRSFRAEYTVEVKDTAEHLLHVTATFGNLEQPYLDVALPVWTPGVYDAENYALNLRRFTGRDESGARLPALKTQPSTWRIQTSGVTQVTVEFDYVATNVAWNGAGITNRYAFFTGTQLFLEPIGHRHAPSTVRFIVPTGWGIVSPLRETADASVFAAANYDELVDAPTVLGSFDIARFEVHGKPHFVATVPAAAECGDVPGFVEIAPKIIATQRAIFGSLPYDKYVFFCVSGMAGGALEHANSSVYSWLEPGSLAHEFFHLWNVKRIRPAEMWPYDYARVNPGPSLWVSEGITSYYEALTVYRAGVEASNTPREGAGPSIPPLTGEANLLHRLASTISRIESNPERHHISPTDASMSGGLAYNATGFAYSMGEVLGALLDLSILHDTRGARCLDDVMRALYTQHYERGRGFTSDDLIQILNATAGRDYTGFFRRYVTGTRVPPYDSIWGYAGYRLSRSSRKLGVLGVAARSTPEGRHVYGLGDRRSPAALADIQVGDVIVAVDGVPIHQVPLTNLFGKNWIGGRFLGKAGERVILRIVRDGKAQDIPVRLATREEINFRIERDPAAMPEQVAIRSAWLKR